MYRAALLAFALLAAVPALASPDITLVPSSSSYKAMSTTVSTNGQFISPSSFASAILDGSHYPLTASILGVPALSECKTLETRSDGYTIVYQRTGGNSLVKSRQYVIALKTVTLTDTKAVVQWDLVQHTFDGSTYSGPYASALNAHPDAVYTPYNHGRWSLDDTAGTVTYWVQSDPGGSLPSWLVNQDAVMAFPLELLKTKWGIGG